MRRVGVARAAFPRGSFPYRPVPSAARGADCRALPVQKVFCPMKRSAILIALPIALLVVSLLPCQASAGITFTKVADTATLIPDGTGNFASLGSASIDNGRVVFVGSGASGQTGIYEYYDGQLSMRVNQSTPIPGGTGGFTKFDIPSLDGADIAFRAEGTSKQAGVYMQYDGALVKIADKNTQIPGTKVNFNISAPVAGLNTGDVVLKGGQVLFQDGGIYLGTSSGITVIASRATGTPIPDQPYSFNVFGFDFSPDFSGDAVVFPGRFADFSSDFFTDGLFHWSEATGIQTILNEHSILDGATEAIGHFLAMPQFDQGTGYVNLFSVPRLSIINLSMGGTKWEGLFRIDGTDLISVISPAESQILLYFAIDNGRVMLAGIDGAIRIHEGGSQNQLVGPGDSIDGKTVEGHTSLESIGKQSLNGNQAVVSLKFTDGSSGLYMATIPEPSTLAMAATALAALGLMVRRRPRRGSASPSREPRLDA